MADPNTFFSEMQQDIYNSKTEKNLKYLSKSAKKFLDSYLAQPITSAYKKTLLAGYRKISKLIKQKTKTL